MEIRGAHEVQILHEIELDFKSGLSDTGKVSVTIDSKDTLCARPYRKLVIRDGETKKISGEFEKRNYLVFFPHDELTGFRFCLEQDGEKYLGADYFHFGQSDWTVKVSCEIEGDAKPTEVWTKSPYPGEYVEHCRVQKAEEREEEPWMACSSSPHNMRIGEDLILK